DRLDLTLVLVMPALVLAAPHDGAARRKVALNVGPEEILLDHPRRREGLPDVRCGRIDCLPNGHGVLRHGGFSLIFLGNRGTRCPVECPPFPAPIAETHPQPPI